MKEIGYEKVDSSHSRFNSPAGTVEPGEVFYVNTELNTGKWLKGLNDVFSNDKVEGPNLSVCIKVAGAKPGDALAVKILEVVPENMGYTGFDGNYGLQGLIKYRPWGLATKTVSITDGHINWSSKLKIPTAPMVGVLGTAPAGEEFRNTWGGVHGGNIDVQEICAGATVYLPVFVEGALLHIGDVHAIQADGEICYNGGIECRAKVKLQIDIIKQPPKRSCIRLENEEFIMAICCTRSLEEAFYTSAGEILDWMVEGYGFSIEEAYLLMGQVLQARATQFVNPTRSYICKFPKKYLIP